MDVDLLNFRDIVDRALVAVYICDSKLRIIYVNDIVEIATKYSKQELCKMNLLELAYEEDLPKFERL